MKWSILLRLAEFHLAGKYFTDRIARAVRRYRLALADSTLGASAYPATY
jgi:hypothetical protein